MAIKLFEAVEKAVQEMAKDGPSVPSTEDTSGSEPCPKEN